jgi:hypothetical protein
MVLIPKGDSRAMGMKTAVFSWHVELTGLAWPRVLTRAMSGCD